MGLLPVEQQPMNFVSTSTTDLPIRNVMVSNQPCLFLADSLHEVYSCWLLFYTFLISKEFKGSRLGFSTRQDILVLCDKGIYVPYLSWAKGTQEQDQNLATGRDGPGF